MVQLTDKLHSTPFFRLLVPLVAGIVLGGWFPPELKWLFLGLSLCLIFLLYFFISTNFKQEPIFGILLFPVLVFIGAFIRTDNTYMPQPLPEGKYYAIADEFPLEKEKSYRLLIRLIEPEIKVLAYIDKSVTIDSIEPGSVLCFRGKPEVMKKTGNPFEFDYAEYSVRNGIGHRIYLNSNNIHFIKTEKKLNLFEFSLVIRDKLIKILENSGLKGEVLHLVSAVALGAREDLEPETTQSFSKTGVIHVLAVSGMNVGIIYIVIEFLLGFMKRKKAGIIIQTLMILTGLWGYALITGLSASVLRAAAMFTFIVVGKSFSRRPEIYNILASSAFVLLCFNPFLVYDVGFQLSYAAVFSIVYFHPYLYKLLYFKYWIPDQVWILLSVSVAAQIGTLPFLLHYFHQFPTWFLLANLMVIPLVTLILYLSFIVFAVAPLVPFLGALMARILDLAGQGMLFSVRFVEQLPNALISNLYPSDISLVLFVLFLILFGIFIIYKIPKALLFAFSSLIILLTINITSNFQTLSRKEIVVFNLQGRTLVALTSASETYWVTTPNSGTVEKLNYYIKPYEGYRKIEKSTIIYVSDTSKVKTDNLLCINRFINFKGIRIYLCNIGSIKESEWGKFPQVDLFLISEKSKTDIEAIPPQFPSAEIVDCRIMNKKNEGKSAQENNLIEPEVLKTAIGGAVQLKIGQGNEIWWSGYYNR
jgi:competence protein ComEC